MKEIFIKPASTWLKMEIDEGTVIALSFQLANIGDASIYANRSNNISFPNTAVNRLNIQNAQIPNSAGVVQYAKTEAKYIEDGIDLLTDCYLIINSIKNNIEATLYSGNFDLISTLAEKKLNVGTDYGTTDLTEFDLVWDAANVDAQKAVTVGVKFPLIDWFSDSPWEAPEYYMSETVRTMWVKYYRPAIFLQTLIDYIITGHGFTYGSATSPILLNDLYLKSIIPCISHISTEDEDMGYAITTVDTANRANGYYDLLFDAIYAGSINNFQFFVQQATVTEFNVTATGKYKGTYTHVATVSFAGASWENGLEIRNQNNDVLFEYHQVIPTPITVAILSTSFEIDVYEGDVIRLVLYNYSPAGYHIKFGSVEWTIVKNAGEPVGIGTKYPIANNLPDITQIDLLKWFLHMFGCFIKQTKDKTIWFKQIDEFITDCGSPNNAIDWSDKFAPDEEPEINFVTELAQKNNFKYTEDDPLALTKYDSFIAIDDKTIQPENDFVQSPFAASEQNIRMAGLKFPSIKAITDFDWSESIQPRILIDNTSTPSGGALTVDDEFSTATISANFPLCYFVNPTPGSPDLTMQSLIAENYVGFAKVFNHPKIIKQRFWLSIMDIYNLDQFIPIYCSQLGGYYIVMKVSNWIKGEATECELLKIV